MQPIALAPHRRTSISAAHSRSPSGRDSPLGTAMLQSAVPGPEAGKWVESWTHIHARGGSLPMSPSSASLTFADVDLIDSRIVAVDADCTVEDACDASLTLGLRCPCLCIPVVAPQRRYLVSSSPSTTWRTNRGRSISWPLRRARPRHSDRILL